VDDVEDAQPVNRFLVRATLVGVVILASGLAQALSPVSAQLSPGAVCISTYADLNGNGMRDADESVLAGVNVNLATGGVIIATHVSAAGEEQYCFEDLLPGVYTLIFTDSPTYRATTSNEGTYALSEGQRLTISGFGAVPVPPEDLRDEVAAKIAASDPDEPVEPSTRLVVAGIASMAVMLFMIGVGAVILGMMSGRRPRREPPDANNYSPGA
jgi:hypothetical protein